MGHSELLFLIPAVVLPIFLGLAVLVALGVWLNLRARRAFQAMLQEVATSGEKVQRGPEPGLYRGSSGGFPKVKGNGTLLLTDRRLLFQKSIGARIEVPVDEITGVREDKWFLGAYRNGREHLILQTDRGEVGFMMGDHAGWMAALQAVAGARSTEETA